MSIKQLHSIEELHQFVQQTGKQLLFKHSTTCPISAKAHDEFQAFMNDSDISAAIVHVIEDRSLSNHIAEEFGIKHESPQIFMLENGEVKWNASHWKITQNSIKGALTNE
ncbi:MAG TPA: bacillithiol system redox-active protein YtxJ [Pseudoneobacillus sp.]|nr:bacillithiol system redox-active protein YtxJ [Pseudoneobacillus sp.]